MRRISLSAFARLSCACAVLFAAPAAHGAATITLINGDFAGVGFNDPTPVAPVGGNYGITLGAQRLAVFQQAFSTWGVLLTSNVTIRVLATWEALPCNSTSGVLGSAGTLEVFSDFAGAEFPNTWYHKALASKLIGMDPDPATADIRARFNVNVGVGGCLGGTGWYYGLDGNEGTKVDLLAVVLHELSHGLGFKALVSGTSGAHLAGQPDLFERFLFDESTGKGWPDMSNAERASSAVNTGNLVWNGLAANTRARSRQIPPAIVTVLAPAAIAGVYGAGRATFGAPHSAPEVEAAVVQADDGVEPASDACGALLNAAEVAGRIALVDRATSSRTSCGDYSDAVLNCQNAGAVGVIFVNNVAGPPVVMEDSSSAITIPAVMVAQADGNAIRAQLAAGVTARIGAEDARPSGLHASGKLLMYAPNPLEIGSSMSHFDSSATPNLLMEPMVNGDISGVDLTLYALEDFGWLPRTTSILPVEPRLALGSNAPNPFHAVTAIRFELARAGLAQLAIYDVNGRLVTRLANRWFPAGAHSTLWDGTDDDGRRVTPGVYLSRLTMAGEVRIGRVVHIH